MKRIITPRKTFTLVSKSAVLLTLATCFLFLLTFSQSWGQNLTISSSGQTGTSGTTWSISGNTLTVTGTADVNTSVIESALANGDLYIVTGNIDFTANVTSTTANFLHIRAAGYIECQPNTSLITNGGDIIFWTTTTDGSGYIRPATITTNGGHVYMGGNYESIGEAVWHGHTVGGGYAFYSANAGVALRGNITTNGGDVLIAGESAVTNLGDVAAESSNRTISTGTGNITLMPYSETLQNNYSLWGPFQMILETTGKVSVAPVSGHSFWGGQTPQLTYNGSLSSGTFTGSSALAGVQIPNIANLGGLELGTYSGTGVVGDSPYVDANVKNMRLDAGFSIAGPISVYGGDIAVNENLTSTGAGSDILFKGSGSIILAASRTLQSNNGDVIFWADSDADGGFITINAGASISTQGGDLVFAGGLDDGSNGGVASDGIPDGFAWRKTVDNDFGGLSLGEGGIASPALISLNSGGGNIILRGTTSDASDHPGVLTQEALLIDAGSGTIDVNGTSSTGHGIEMGFGTSTLELAIRSASNLATAISIQGATTAAGKGGFFNLSSGSSLIQAEGTGAITISGTSTLHEGMVLDNLQILSASGKISLTGTGPNGGQLLRNTDLGLRSSATAIQGITPLVSSSADVDLIANTLSFSNSANTIASTGTLRILPSGDSFSSALTLGADFDPGVNLTGLVVGKNHATPADLTLDKGVTIAGPISVYGGDITVNESLTATASGADILLKASGYIAMASGSSNSAYRTLQTNNGNIVLWANSADGTSGGIQLGDWVTLNSANGSIAQSTGGGKVWLAGGSGVNAQGLPTGAANGGTARSGISFGSYSPAATTTSIYSGGGDIYLNGESNAINPGLGVVWNRTGIANAGNGTVTIKGEAKNANGQHGIELGASSGSINIISGGGDASTPAILINGITARSDIFRGLQTISGPGTRSIMQATGTGGITILAKGVNSGTAASYASTLDVLAASGDILISAEGGTGLDQVGTIGQKTGTDVTSSFSNVTLRANAINVFAGTEVQTTGTLVVEPFGTSFTNALTWPLSNLTLGSGITGLTLGKEGNTANITTTTAQTIAGPISVYADDITVNQNLTSTASGADILLKASGNITTAASRTLQTNGGNITLWADADGPNGGAIFLGNSNTLDSRTSADRTAANTLTASGGGHITLAGGSAVDANGLPTGYAINLSAHGVQLGTSNSGTVAIYSGGGDVRIKGESKAANSTSNYGVNVLSALTIHTSTGRLDMQGQSSGNSGIKANDANLSIVSAATSGAAISLVGNTTSTNGRGVEMLNAATKTIAATGGGSITVTGSNNATTWGQTVALTNTNVLSQSGAIELSGSQDILFVSGVNLGSLASSPVTSSSAPITLTGNKITTQTGSTTISTSGTVTMQPSGDDFTASPTLTSFSFSGNETGLTIGKSATSADGTSDTDVTLGAITMNGPISVYGRSITANGNINTSAGNANGDILLKASGNIVQSASKTITTNNGDVILWANSDGAAANGSVLLRNESTITTNGGHVWMGGGSGSTTWNGLAVGNGQAVSGTTFVTPVSGTTVYESGIYLEKASIQSGGGNVYLAGSSAGTEGGFDFGVLTYDVCSINSGSGTITIIGGTESSTERGMVVGVQYSNQPGSLTLTSESTQAIAIDVEARSASNFGLALEGEFNLISTQSGGINFTTIGSTAGTRLGFSANPGTLNVLATSGPIVINTGASGFDKGSSTSNTQKAFFGSKSGTSVISSSSNIQFISDDLVELDAMNFATSGTLSIEPFNTSFTADFTTNNLNYTGLSGLTIGKSTNTQNITFGSVTNIAGPITVFGGTIAINAALTATNSNINLTASTAVTQSAAITANGLGLSGAGTFTLTNPANNIATIAGGSAAAKIGSLSFVDASGGLEIGTVNPTGITATGPVKIETLEGNITLSQNIATDNTSADAIILNAGKNSAIGTATGGDIIVTGSPTLTMGSSGIAKLFSGSEEGSTGLNTLVGGTANVRESVDETSAAFTPALSINNKYALYRKGDLGLGGLTIVSSGGAALNSGWEFSNNTIKPTSGTAVSINASVINNYLASGPLTIRAGSITFNANINSTTANRFSVLSNTFINNSSATSITTQDGDVLFATNVDDATDNESTTNGTAQFRFGLTITTNGGDITIGGENITGTGYALGSSAEDYTEGIRIDGTVNINSSGGNIVMRGKSYARAVRELYGASGLGFYFLNSAGNINSGSGTINLDGFSQTSGSSYSSGIIVFTNNAAFPLTIQSANQTADAIKISGKATGTTGEAFGIETEATSILNVLATGTGGGITLNTGNKIANGNELVFRGTTSILAKSGQIKIFRRTRWSCINGYRTLRIPTLLGF